jgi:6-phosphogluconolactonase
MDQLNGETDRSKAMKTSLVRCLWAWGTVIGLCHVSIAAETEYWVYFGAYSSPENPGISVSEFSAETGQLSTARLATETVNPSFLAVHPSQKYLYAVGEIADQGGKPGGGVSAFAIDQQTGGLTALNQQSSVGAGPCHVVVNAAGTTALVANYGGGSVVSYAIAADGRLQPAASVMQHAGHSVNPQRQTAPHAHSVRFHPKGPWAVSADLGLDQVLIYRVDAATSKLSPNTPPFGTVAPGSGPRHVTFNADGTVAYVINELSNTVTMFQCDPSTGAMKERQTISTLPEGFTGTSYTAEVVVHPSGKFVYGSNRGHDSLAEFRVNPNDGTLTFLGTISTGGKTPRNFNVDPTGRWVLAANQGTDNVVVLSVDMETGRLSATDRSITVSKAVCVTFVPRVPKN